MSNLTIEEALKILKESCCEMCTYGARGMDDCVIHSCNKRDAIRALEQDISELKQERNKSEDPDLTIEEKFFKDWGKRPFYNDRFEYLCPAEVASLLPLQYQDEFIKGCIGLDLDLSDPNRCNNCKKRFWKSKYKRPEKKEDEV